MDTLWSDVSEFQVPVDDSYPYQVLAIRSNDGTYQDHKFAQNYGWSRRALDSGRLRALIIYMVYRQNWLDTLNTTKAMVGEPHPRTVFMLDVESWGGQITGDQSDGINRLYRGLADWLGNPARVIGYGNVGDLNSLWPTKPPGVRLILAAYGSNPNYLGKIAHQFTDGLVDPLWVPPFGNADVNSADGLGVEEFCAAVGLSGFTTRSDPMEADLMATVNFEKGTHIAKLVVDPVGTSLVLPTGSRAWFRADYFAPNPANPTAPTPGAEHAHVSWMAFKTQNGQGDKQFDPFDMPHRTDQYWELPADCSSVELVVAVPDGGAFGGLISWTRP